MINKEAGNCFHRPCYFRINSGYIQFLFHLLDAAFLSSAKYPVPVSGNDIIEEVADKGRNYDKSIK